MYLVCINIGSVYNHLKLVWLPPIPPEKWRILNCFVRFEVFSAFSFNGWAWKVSMLAQVMLGNTPNLMKTRSAWFNNILYPKFLSHFPSLSPPPTLPQRRHLKPPSPLPHSSASTNFCCSTSLPTTHSPLSILCYILHHSNKIQRKLATLFFSLFFHLFFSKSSVFLFYRFFCVLFSHELGQFCFWVYHLDRWALRW